MSQAVSIDHVGIVGSDLDPLAAVFERLGFTVTPFARHAGGRTGNRCVMLHGSYIELLAVMPGGSSATLDRFLARHVGMHILAFGIDDEAAAQSRLIRAGFDAPAPSVTERAVDESAVVEFLAGGPLARFVLVSPPDIPEGRVHLVRHETADLLWRPEVMRHANQALALTELFVVSDDPAASAARLSRLAGRAVTPDPLGGYTLVLPRGRVRIVAETALPDYVPAGPRPRFAGLTISTGDSNASIASLLASAGIPYALDQGCIVLTAGGTWLRFHRRILNLCILKRRAITASENLEYCVPDNFGSPMYRALRPFQRRDMISVQILF